MIIRGYVRVVDRRDAEIAELTGNEDIEEVDELVAIRADYIESLKRNTLYSPDEEFVFECTDVYMYSGEHWVLMAPYEDVYSQWVSMMNYSADYPVLKSTSNY